MNQYFELWKALDVKKGEKIYLSSDIVKFALFLKRQNQVFSCEELLNSLIESVGAQGTIMIPVFNWDIKDGDVFDKKETPGKTGVLGNEALKMGFLRTNNPFHSFAVWGKDSGKLTDLDNELDFGKDSPFAYCWSDGVTQIMLGTDYVHSMTFIHFVESMCDVKYRYEETIRVVYINENNLEETRFYRRRPHKNYGAIEKFNRIGKILEQEGISERIDYCGITCYRVDLRESYNIIKSDIELNKCRNLFDFKTDRDLIF